MKYRQKQIEKFTEAFQMTLAARWNNSDWPAWLHKVWNEGRVAPAAGEDSSGRITVATTDVHIRAVNWGDYIVYYPDDSLGLIRREAFEGNHEMPAPEGTFTVGRDEKGNLAPVPVEEPKPEPKRPNRIRVVGRPKPGSGTDRVHAYDMQFWIGEEQIRVKSFRLHEITSDTEFITATFETFLGEVDLGGAPLEQ